MISRTNARNRLFFLLLAKGNSFCGGIGDPEKSVPDIVALRRNPSQLAGEMLTKTPQVVSIYQRSGKAAVEEIDADADAFPQEIVEAEIPDIRRCDSI